MCAGDETEAFLEARPQLFHYASAQNSRRSRVTFGPSEAGFHLSTNVVSAQPPEPCGGSRQATFISKFSFTSTSFSFSIFPSFRIRKLQSGFRMEAGKGLWSLNGKGADAYHDSEVMGKTEGKGTVHSNSTEAPAQPSKF